MHFYSLSYEELLALPIKMFWFMNTAIDRINAQKDIRSLSVAASSQSGESATSHRERLVMEIGTVITVVENPMNAMNAVKDTVGIADLKAMANEF